MPVLTVNDGGGADYNDYPTAISAAQSGDIIRCTGGGPYTFAWPNNINYGTINFDCDFTNPEDFPEIKIDGGDWVGWWTNQAGTRTFEKLNLRDLQAHIVKADRNIVARSCRMLDTNNIWLNLDGDIVVNQVLFEACIFNLNSGIFMQSPGTKNSIGPYGEVRNCAFYSNTGTIYAGSATAADITNNKLVRFYNCILLSNTTIADSNLITQEWDNNLLATSENPVNWGSNCVFNDDNPWGISDPQTIIDFKPTCDGPAIEIGDINKAPSFDIGGNPYTDPPNAGPWQETTGCVVNGGIKKRSSLKLGLYLESKK